MEQLEIAFGPPVVEPGVSMDKLQFDAGAHSVVVWLRSRIKS